MSSMTIRLDIGGEGRHPGALNLNRSRHKTLGPATGQPIPNLIVGRADVIPLADRSISQVIVERTPLSRQAIAEIARVIAPGGTIVLVHVPLADADRHAPAHRHAARQSTADGTCKSPANGCKRRGSRCRPPRTAPSRISIIARVLFRVIARLGKLQSHLGGNVNTPCVK